MSHKAVTADEMSEIDKRAQEEYGISAEDLMENAGKSVSEIVIKDAASMENENIAVFCGKGNNGGDGFVIARRLFRKNPKELIIFVFDQKKIKEGGAYNNYIKAKELGIKIKEVKDYIDDNRYRENYFTIGIDAVLGTGFSGKLRGFYNNLGKMINSSNFKMYAVDIPSGLNATTGVASDNSLKAFKTVTFGLPKRGFFSEEGKNLCGEIIVKDIGFPEELLGEYQ